jgi:hypothetical protein
MTVPAIEIGKGNGNAGEDLIAIDVDRHAGAMAATVQTRRHCEWAGTVRRS